MAGGSATWLTVFLLGTVPLGCGGSNPHSAEGVEAPVDAEPSQSSTGVPELLRPPPPLKEEALAPRTLSPDVEPEGPEELPPPDGGWSSLDGGYTLEAAECEPDEAVRSRTLYPHACSERSLSADGTLLSLLVREATGNVLEDARWREDGTLIYRTVTSYGAFGPVQSTLEHADGIESASSWRWSPEGVLQEHSIKTRSSERTGVYIYDSEGRLARIEYTNGSGRSATRVTRLHTYDAEGRLVGTEDVGAHANGRREAYAYHPNGALSRWELYRVGCCEGDEYFVSEFDEQGKLLTSIEHAPSNSISSVYRYEDGRPVRMERHRSTGFGAYATLHTWLHDALGRVLLHRRARDAETLGCDSASRVTFRPVYGCTSGALVREEIDTNEDGAVDGVREVVRDEGGNVIEERYLETMVTWSGRTRGTTRFERDYGCFR